MLDIKQVDVVKTSRFYQKSVISLGDEKASMYVHNNAPVVLNFYRVVRGKKVYNLDQWNMKFSSRESANWTLGIMNCYSDHYKSKKVWYIAN